MSDRIHVATRKGLFTLERRRTGWEIGRTAFLGDPVTMVLDDPRDGTLYAALNLGHFGVKLHRSTDGGTKWEEIVAPAFAEERQAKDGDKPADGPSVHQVWEVTAGGTDQPGRLWAGTIPGALFRSDDRGASWDLVRTLWDRPERARWFGGGYDQPGIHSICVDPRDAQHLTVGVSCGGVWVTRDGGETWTLRADGMRAAYMPPDQAQDPEIQDPHRLANCPSAPDVFWAQHHNGIFRTTDDCAHWEEITTAEPANFGFAVAVHPRDPQTAWFVPGVKDECRIPVDGKVVVSRTRDGGRSFDVLREGLPQEHAYDLTFRHALDVDDDGERLVFGSTTGSLWITENGGDAWRTVTHHLPPVYQTRFAR